MRYVWEGQEAYATAVPGGALGRAAFDLLARRLRRWDVASTARADALVANSRYTQDRIRRYYGRERDGHRAARRRAALRARFRIGPPPAPPSRSTCASRRWSPTSGSSWRCGRSPGGAPAWWSSATAPTGRAWPRWRARQRGAARPGRRRRARSALRRLRRRHSPRDRRLRHRPRRGARGRAAGGRVRGGGRAGQRARRRRPASCSPRRRPRRWGRPWRGSRGCASIRRGCGRAARRFDRVEFERRFGAFVDERLERRVDRGAASA